MSSRSKACSETERLAPVMIHASPPVTKQPMLGRVTLRKNRSNSPSSPAPVSAFPQPSEGVTMPALSGSGLIEEDFTISIALCVLDAKG